ncbi:MAG: glycosyltransferase family 2 protein [Planctomycetes bacterium]|nr:glycosyltransferase family 2 protein [Planctomycetota bacterium]
MSRPVLTIVVPAYNEQDNIQPAVAACLEALDRFAISGEVIVVDDASSDSTGAKVQECIARDARVRYVRHQTNKSIGGAFWTGVENAAGEMVCLIPGDNETIPAEILRFHKLMDDVDIVVPFVFDRKSRPAWRIFISLVYIFIVDLTFRTSFKYTNGTCIYRKSLLDELDYHCDSFFFQTDILVRLVKRDYLYAEVPYRISRRVSGDSKAVTFGQFRKVAAGYLRLMWDIYFRHRRSSRPAFAPDSVTARRYADSRNVPVESLVRKEAANA